MQYSLSTLRKRLTRPVIHSRKVISGIITMVGAMFTLWMVNESLDTRF